MNDVKVIDVSKKDFEAMRIRVDEEVSAEFFFMEKDDEGNLNVRIGIRFDSLSENLKKEIRRELKFN